jgi:competence protein ComEC
LVIFRPASLGSLGFQLSFLVTFAILLGKNLLKTEGELRGILKIGLFANLVALPLLLAVNHRFNPLSIPANLFFVLFVERLLFPLTFITAFIPGFFPLFRLVSGFFQTAVVRLATIDCGFFFNFVTDLGKSLYFLGIGSLFIAIERKRNIRKNLVALMLLILAEAFAGVFPGVTYVRVLDVGQGDAIHIRSGSVNVLIDTGKPDSQDALIQYFRGENIRKIDAVFLTHDHADHTGEISDLAEAFPIGEIWVGYDLPSLGERPHSIVHTGEEISVGSLVFSVLSSRPEAVDENDRSLVLSVRIGCHDWILTGDAGAETEAAILDRTPVRADILKVGHHGSPTASSMSWVQATCPLLAVVSVSKENSYGLPDPVILSRWEKVGSEVLRTDRYGSISIYYFPWGHRALVTRTEGEGFFTHEWARMIGFF